MNNNNSILKIALINPPSPFLISDTVMPPLGLMYLSSYIKQNISDINVEIIDLAIDKNIEIPNDYDIYAFTSTTPQYNITLNIMKEIKKINPFSTFIIGGAHASCFSKECKDDGFDCIVIGEGEEALLSIINNIKEYKKNNSYIRGFFKFNNIQNINSIPFPDRTFSNFTNYNYTLNNKKCTTMITSRGCPFNCAFCCKIWDNKVRLRSSENVLKEVQEIQSQHNIQAIMFYDDTFTISKKRLIEICKELKKLNITWRCFIHVNTVSKKILELMYKSGCVEVGMGVESGSQDILNIINKNISIDKAIEVCNWCHNIGLRIKIFLIIGLPNESHKSIEDTINFIRKAKPDDFDYSIYTPFPNTDIWNNQSKYNIIFDKDKLDYSKMFYKGKFGQYSSQVSTSHISQQEIEKLRDYVDVNIKKEI